MKTDADLKREVEAELAWDPAVQSAAVGVAAKNGVVTLTGHLETYSEKWAVEKALRRVEGVKAIALELDVRLSPDHQRSDTDIANAAEHALQWHSQVPPEAIRITVDKGWITLQGEVDWYFQRRSAVKAVRSLKGVVGVTDEIALRHQPTPAGLAQRVQEALMRQAVRAARHVDIQVQDGTVTLRGTVHSWHERDAAQGVVWSAPGVRNVVNELKIG
jgi:osmotically-inducible protein OsmY